MNSPITIPRVLLSLSIAAMVCCGCGGGGTDLGKHGSVSGTVTFDGKPVELGQITFTPVGKEGTVTGAEIKNGKYSVSREAGPLVGQHKVSIHANRKSGAQIPAIMPAPEGTMIDVMEEYIPTKYNFESTLTAEIKAGDNPKVDFDLKAE
ncbi:MAG: hypothetical protein EXS05_01930 [Planctomycetaceae bacterium]|nr:hypothetical protein [Planctomycetaceae bacterium]